MHKEVTHTRFAPTLDAPPADCEPPEMDLRVGARVGDVRIRRSREQRRGMLKALRGVPRAIRRAAHIG